MIADETICECGVPVDEHEPLGKAPPLRSWKSAKMTDARLSEAARRMVSPGMRRPIVPPRVKT
jgi:hypothetical protein